MEPCGSGEESRLPPPPAPRPTISPARVDRERAGLRPARVDADDEVQPRSNLATDEPYTGSRRSMDRRGTTPRRRRAMRRCSAAACSARRAGGTRRGSRRRSIRDGTTGLRARRSDQDAQRRPRASRATMSVALRAPPPATSTRGPWQPRRHARAVAMVATVSAVAVAMASSSEPPWRVTTSMRRCANGAPNSSRPVLFGPRFEKYPCERNSASAAWSTRPRRAPPPSLSSSLPPDGASHRVDDHVAGPGVEGDHVVGARRSG